MPQQIFVNLPVRDLQRSIAFYKALGYEFNPRFTDDKGACMVVADGSIYVMLLVQPFFQGFTPKPVADAHATTQMLLCLSMDNADAVKAFVAKAVAAGATQSTEPKDYGFMYQHGYEDLDGHMWELMWMDPKAIEQGAHENIEA